MAEVNDKKTQQQNDAGRVYKYVGGGFTTNTNDNYFHSPYSGRPAPVTIEGKVIKEGTPERSNYQYAMQNYDKQRSMSEGGLAVNDKALEDNSNGNNVVYNNGTVSNGGNRKSSTNRTSNGAKNLGNTVSQTTQNNVTTNEMINTQSNPKAVSNRTLPVGVDPIAYRQNYNTGNIVGYDPEADLNPEYLANMDMNTPISGANQRFDQYGDDSSRANQATPGGMNEKYTGSNTKNSDVNYNPDITTADLNQNYVYGKTSQVYGTLHPGYISQRNDNIASALYNEGRVSKEQVAEFLSQQSGWMNSSEEDRINTIESVWKRIGAIQAMQKEPIDPNALTEDAAGKLYGKVTAEGGNPIQGIDTIADANSIYAQMSQARVVNVNALRSMQPVNAATSTYYGTTPYGDQALRDVQNLDPEWYAQYQQELKKLYTQDKANTISHGSADDKGPSIVDSIEETIVNDNKNWTDKNSNERTYDQVAGELEKKLQSNQTASSAKQEMINIKKDLADLNSELEDLPNKAKKAFKGDVPDYIYQAYISNNRQELQKKIQNLENRYASLADIYKTEVSQTQREMEYKLKQDQLEMDRNKMNFDMAYKQAQLEQDSIHRSDGKAYKIVDGQIIQLDDGTAYAGYQNKVNAGLNSMEQMAASNATYGQCEQFTDDAAEATAGVRMVGAGGRSATTSDEKNWYATQFGLFSDYIPEVGDVAVFDYRNAKNVSEASRKRGHTMYVAGYNAETGMIHLIGSNGGKGLENKVYSKDISVEDFYKNYGVGFWNPYKYAQWQSMQTSGSNNTGYSPMQPTIDKLMEEYRDSGKTNMFNNLGTFQEIYTSLWRADRKGELSSLLNQGVIGTFFQNLALSRAQSQGGDANIDDRAAIERFLSLTMEQILAEADNYLAQHLGEEKAYAGFQEMMRAVEIKLRDESGAAINRSERATNFLLYLPKGSDTEYVKERKLERLEEYIRRLGTDAGIDSSTYIPLNLGKKKEEKRSTN